MKKLALTIAIIFSMTLTTFAQEGSGLFRRGKAANQDYAYNYSDRNAASLLLPNSHSRMDDQTATAPLGGGALLLIGFGAAYAMKKRREK